MFKGVREDLLKRLEINSADQPVPAFDLWACFSDFSFNAARAMVGEGGGAGPKHQRPDCRRSFFLEQLGFASKLCSARVRPHLRSFSGDRYSEAEKKKKKETLVALTQHFEKPEELRLTGRDAKE